MGGLDQNIEPQVMDIVAPENGAHRQNNQLKSFEPGCWEIRRTLSGRKRVEVF